MPSSFTSFVDGDPSSPEHFNSKFAPLVDAVVNVTGIEIKSDGSSLGTATTLNFVGSSSVSSQAAGQISIAVPTITGTGSKYARFNSGGTFIEDANLQDSGETVTHLQYDQPAIIRISRYGGSSSATTALASNTSVGGLDFWSSSSTGREFRGGSFRLWTQSPTAGDLNARFEWSLQTNTGSDRSVLELTTTQLSPTAASHALLQLGGDGRLFNRVSAREFRAVTEQPSTAFTIETRLYGVYDASPNLPYSVVDSAASELRLETSGLADAGIVRLVLYTDTEAYFSPYTGPVAVVRLGSPNRRWYATHTQGLSCRAFTTISSYSATTMDNNISVDSSSNLTVSLPAPSTVSGFLFSVKRLGAGTLEVNAGSGASIDNFSVYTLGSQFSVVHVQSIGTRYITL